MITLRDDSKDSLVCMIEIHDACTTIYGRVKDDAQKWAPKMQDLIKAVKPDTTAHFSDEERAVFHPNGSPKKRGEYYFHHVHTKLGPNEILEALQPFASEGLLNQYTEYHKGI